MAKGRGDNSGKTIVLRKEEVVEGEHHGGAWKVAYADFVTAMMAFFLLLWLLNATTEEQRQGLADYFSPMNIFGRTVSGNGQPFGGQTPHDQGTEISNLGQVDIIPGPQQVQLDIEEDDSDTRAEPQQFRDGGEDPQPHADGGPRAEPRPATGASEAPEANGGDYAREAVVPPRMAEERAAEKQQEEARHEEQAAPQPQPAEPTPAQREERAFAAAADSIRESLRADPRIADLEPQLAIDTTPEGLRVQLIDAERQSMFALGSSVPNERAQALMARIAPVLAALPNAISISGHTDAAPFRGSERSNWELSAERANATRRVLVGAGVPEGRIRSVTGNADRDLLVPDDPLAAANRRIAIVVLRQEKEAP